MAVHPLPDLGHAERTAGAGFDTPTGGGDDGGMDARLTALETKWETVVPTLATKADLTELKLATKADLADLKTEVHKGFADMVKWIVGTSVVLGVAGITVMTFVLNNAVPKAASMPQAQQAPIIIQVPAYAAPPVVAASRP